MGRAPSGSNSSLQSGDTGNSSSLRGFGSQHLSSNGRWYPHMGERTCVIVGGFPVDTARAQIEETLKKIASPYGQAVRKTRCPWEKASKGYIETWDATTARQIGAGALSADGYDRLWARVDTSAEERRMLRVGKAAIDALKEAAPQELQRVTFDRARADIVHKTTVIGTVTANNTTVDWNENVWTGMKLHEKLNRETLNENIARRVEL